jgi:hypothetical protein
VGQESRCDSCVYARIIRGYSESEKITLCDRIFEPIRIPFPVRECSDYLDKRLPCIEDLEDLAWVLRSKNAGKTAGFTPATAPDLQESAVGEEEPEQTPAAVSDNEKRSNRKDQHQWPVQTHFPG